MSTVKQDAFDAFRCWKIEKRKDSTYWCPDCKVGLCIKDCFEIYHTQLHYYRLDGPRNENQSMSDESNENIPVVD